LVTRPSVTGYLASGNASSAPGSSHRGGGERPPRSTSPSTGGTCVIRRAVLTQASLQAPRAQFYPHHRLLCHAIFAAIIGQGRTRLVLEITSPTIADDRPWSCGYCARQSSMPAHS
jgi:hypothetical protein